MLLLAIALGAGTVAADSPAELEGNGIDSGSDSWTNVSSMPTPRSGHAVAVVDGMIYAIGGYDGSGRTSVVERYDPGSDSWTNVSSMPTVKGGIGAATLNGEVYVVGDGSSVER